MVGKKKIHKAIRSTGIKADGEKELNTQHLHLKIATVRVFRWRSPQGGKEMESGGRQVERTVAAPSSSCSPGS